jgi:site-specific recombinase XerD
MSVNTHPTQPEYQQIRFYPEGKKGKQKVVKYRGTREQALLHQAMLKKSLSPVATQNYIPQVKEAIPHYIEYYKLNHLAPGVQARYLELRKPYIANMTFNLITPPTIEQYKMDRLRKNIKPTTINKELSALSGLLKWAKKKGYVFQVTDVERFPDKMCKAPLPDVPTREEVLALIDGMIWPKCGLFACLYYGGLRKAEATLLTAENIHLERGVMIVRGKGNKQRVVPIVDNLRPWLEKRLKEVDTGYLWTTRNNKPITDLKKIVKLAKERAGLKRHIYPHLLRHAFGTHATMSGVNLRSLQNIMGHTTSKTTEIYTTLSSGAMIEELTGKFGNSD